MTILPDASEDTRMKGLYEDLRLRLLDLSKRNQLLNYGLSARSKRYLQIVDATLEGAHMLLAGDEAALRIAPLPEPCDSAWNKDPVFGVIGIQSGPRG
jgi:hypothetical protein